MVAENSKRNYAKALDHLFAFAGGRPLSRELMLEWRASMEKQSPSTVNLRLSAMRSLVAEAKRAGMLSSEEAEKLSDIPNIKQQARGRETGSPASRRRNCWQCLTAQSLKASAIM